MTSHHRILAWAVLVFATVFPLLAATDLAARSVIDPERCITVCNARVSRYTPLTCECKR